MAHMMESNDSMVSGSNVTPWHGLGTVTIGQVSAQEALEKAKLNWTVEHGEVFDSDMTKLDGYKLNRRSDDKTVLSVVPNSWTALQNSELLEIAESLGQIDGLDYKPVIETAGSLKGGKIVWALIQTNQRTFADSLHKQYLLLTNGHYIGRGVRGTLTDTRVVCWNTLSAAESAKESLFVTHTRNVKQRIAAAIETLGWANDSTNATFAIYDALATTHITPDAAVEFFAELFPDKEEMPSAPVIVGEMLDLFRNGKGNDGKTLFSAVNAVTDWVDHVREFRDGEGIAERRFMYANMGGEGDRMKRQAFKNATALANA